MEMALKGPMVWVDLEMTGLDPGRHHILEAAVILTDGALDTVIEGPHEVVHASEDVLATMTPWCRRTFARSGLTEACRQSDVQLVEAERRIMSFLTRHLQPGCAPLAGNSVSFDRAFLEIHMPCVATFLHYRTVDVSTLKELCVRWYPAITPPRKKTSHRALEDIRESIEELRFYRHHIFLPPREAESGGDGN